MRWLLEPHKRKLTLELAQCELQQFNSTSGFKGGEKPYYRMTKDGRVYRLISMAWPNKKLAPEEYFDPIVDPCTGISYDAPSKGWRYPPATISSLIQRGLIEFPKDGESQPQKVLFLDKNMSERIPSIIKFGGSDEALFKDLKVSFDYQKPISLCSELLSVFSDKDSIVLDSFAGSGTTGHAVWDQNSKDGGKRRFILIEMIPDICRGVTSKRLRAISNGYKTTKGKAVPGLGGGFQYCRLSAEPLFNEFGDIREDVTYAQLADFVWFAETGTGYAGRGDSPLLGVHEDRAIYLLFNGILGDRRPDGGNILTRPILESLPPHEGEKVIYAAATRLGEAALRRAAITFKQTPYAIHV